MNPRVLANTARLIGSIVALVFWQGCGPPSPNVELPDPPDLAELSPGIQDQYHQLRRAWTETLEAGEPDAAARAWGDLGHWHQLYRYPQTARRCYEAAQRLDPEEPRWHYFAARLAADEGSIESARRDFQTVLELAPESSAARIRLAELEMLEQPDVAAELFREVLRNDPSHARALYGLGRIAFERGEIDEAVVHLESALESAPESPGPHYLLGQAYGRRGETERAEEHLRRVPADNRTWGTISIDDPWNRELQRLNLSTRSRRRQASRALEGGDVRSAVRILQQAVLADPENLSLRHHLATTLFNAGRFGAAREQLLEILRRRPEDSAVLLMLSELSLRRGKSADAASHLRTAIAADPKLAEARLSLAALLVAEDEIEEALVHYAATRDRSVVAAFRHAAALMQLDRWSDAAQALEEDLRRRPDARILRLLAARLTAAAPQSELRDGDAALRQAGPEESAENLADVASLAMAYAELGRFERAVALQRAVVEAAERADEREVLHRARRRLALYEQGKPCRNPWERDEKLAALQSIRVEIP